MRQETPDSWGGCRDWPSIRVACMTPDEKKTLVRQWFAEIDKGAQATSIASSRPTTSTTIRHQSRS